MSATDETANSIPLPEADGGAARSRPRARARARARKGEGPRLREEILDATERLLLQTGSAEAVSIRAVADAVGVTAPSIYRHFPDKHTLIFEVCARHFDALDQHLAEAVEGIDDPVAALAAAGRAYVRFGRLHHEPYRIMFMTRPDLMPVGAQEEWMRGSAPFVHLVDMVQAAIDAGALRPEHHDAVQVAIGVWARVHGLTSLLVSKPFLPLDDAFVDDYVESSLRGIAASGR